MRKRLKNGLGEGFHRLMEALREIFDESAYLRFLQSHGLANNCEAYALYLRESNSTRERRPRCC
jgi:hypothetical protein